MGITKININQPFEAPESTVTSFEQEGKGKKWQRARIKDLHIGLILDVPILLKVPVVQESKIRRYMYRKIAIAKSAKMGKYHTHFV